MVESKFSLEKELKPKLSLSYYGTLNDTTEISDDNQFDPIYNLLTSFSEIEDIRKIDKPEKMKFFYFNKKIINKHLYENEEVIKINFTIIQNKYSEYFYLTVLIEETTEIVNYKYNSQFIKKINDQIKEAQNGSLRELMMSKILLVLIENFTGTEEYNDNNKSEIDEINNTNFERIERNINKLKDLNLNKEAIQNKKIEEIYIGIIINLIETNKIDDINYANNIMKQLDLENINITKTMYVGLASVLKSDNDYMKKYIISDKNDLYNDDIINFYYILFKYILKKPIYIYQIHFLNEIRKKILTIIKDDIGKFKNEKLEYIINFFSDSYYTVLLNKFDIKKDKSMSKYDDNSTTKARSHVSQSIQTASSSFEREDNSIIKFEKHIENPKLKNSKFENYTRLIREMSNGDIIRLHNVNDITIYKNDEEPKIIIFNSINSSEYEMMTNSNNRNRINLKELKSKTELQSNKSINNLIETNESIEKKDKNFIQVMECSKEGLMIYKLSDNEKIIVNTLKLSCTGCFEIKENGYVVIGEKGIYHYKDLKNLEQFPIKCDKDIDKDECQEKDLPFRGCIKINDKYIALTSNSILPNGKDILYIYDTKIQRLIKSLEFSFVVGVNGLNLMDVLEEEDKSQKESQILLCACKKYTDSQKNGIIIIDPNNIEEKEELYDTEDFEVSCFCPLKIKKDNKLQVTNYFLAGGLDEEKRQGMIKLYKVKYNGKEKNDKIKIEFLQEIVIEINDNFEGFNSNIECMIQRQSDGKLLISSADGYLTLFSEPNLDYYLEENKKIEELIKRFS